MSEQTRLKVAFLGLGKMGAGMAGNILRAGFGLSIYNRTHAKTKTLADAGATTASTPREAVAQADVVVSCLMDDRSVIDTVTGDDGILAGLRPDGIHISASTISPEAATQLASLHAKHGSHYVAAPVLGRPDAAAAGQLITFLGGNPEIIQRAMPVIETYARAAIPVSEEHGLANVTKLCANYMASSISDMMGQIYTFADKAGIDLNILNNLFDGAFAAPAFKAYAKRIRTRDFGEENAGFSMSGGLKDLQLILDTANSYGVTLDYASPVARKMQEAMDKGMEGCDWCATYEISRSRAGLD